jgi:hypothetical protein
VYSSFWEFQNVIPLNPVVLHRIKRRDISSEGYAAHPVGVLQPAADYSGSLAHFFKHIRLLGQEWQLTSDYNGCLELFKLKMRLTQLQSTILDLCFFDPMSPQNTGKRW